MGRKDDEDRTRMTARIHAVEPGVIEGDYTIEPPEEADAEVEYVKRFATQAEARAWLEAMARDRDVDPAEVVWVRD